MVLQMSERLVCSAVKTTVAYFSDQQTYRKNIIEYQRARMPTAVEIHPVFTIKVLLCLSV